MMKKERMARRCWFMDKNMILTVTKLLSVKQKMVGQLTGYQRFRYKTGLPYHGIIVEVGDKTSDGTMLLVLFDDGDLEYENDWQLEKLDV